MHCDVTTLCRTDSVQQLTDLTTHLHTEQLQKRMTHQVHTYNMSLIRQQYTDNKQLLAALHATSAPHASLWISGAVLGGTQLMLPAQWRAAVRHRYVLPPASFLYTKQCRCGHYVEDNNLHFHACQLLKKTAVFERHQLVVKAIGRWINSLEGVVIHEPTLPDGSKPDMLVHLHNMSWYVEIAVTCVGLEHNLTTHHSHTTPLASAEARAKSKAAKYKKVLQDMGSVTEFVPFVMESHGGMCKSAITWLQHVATQASTLPAYDLQHVLHDLSTALQIGNALVDTRGMHSLRVHSDVRDSDRVARELQRFAHGTWHVHQQYGSGFNHAALTA